MAGNIIKNPPKFSMDKNYEVYKKELDAWKAITSIDADKLGRVVALSLPENDASDIRNKVFNAVNLDGNDGYTNVVAFLDSEFKKDAVSDMCDKIRAFMKLHKNSSQTMQQYISEFDRAYTTAKNGGLTDLPQQYLMYMLMENALLKDQDFRLVLSSIDFTKTDSLYKHTKEALIKFFGSLKPAQTTDENDPDFMKCDMQACNDHATFYGKNTKFKPNQKWKPPVKSSQNKNFTVSIDERQPKMYLLFSHSRMENLHLS